MPFVIDRVSLNDDRLQLVSAGLDTHAAAFSGARTDYEDFAFIASDGETFLGGAKGKFFNRWVSLSWLYSTRTITGIGSALLGEVEKFGMERAAKGIIVDTLEFQAPAFYEKHGFVSFGEIENFIGKYRRIYMLKRF